MFVIGNHREYKKKMWSNNRSVKIHIHQKILRAVTLPEVTLGVTWI